MTGEGGNSMFYLVAIFLAVYIVGMGIYLTVEKIRKGRKNRDNG